MFKKFIVTSLTILIFAGTTMTAEATVRAELLAEIARLQEIVLNLQEQLRARHQFENGLQLQRNLFLGMRGDDVASLQRFLSDMGDYEYPEITGFYGIVTASAVQRFQCRMMHVCSGTPDINGYGVVGPRTRSALATTKPPSQSTSQTTSFQGNESDDANRRRKSSGSGGGTVDSSCTLNGATIAHGKNITAYKTDLVPYGDTCQSQVRTCTDGELSGTYTFSTCSASIQNTPVKETFFDLVKTFEPSQTEKKIIIGNDTDMSAGSQCTVTYKLLGDTLVTNLSVNQGSAGELRKIWQNSAASVGNWGGNPSLCSSDAVATKAANNALQLYVNGPTGSKGLNFLARKSGVLMNERSVEEMTAEFGELAFPSKEDIPDIGAGAREGKLIFLASPKFDRIGLLDYDEIQLELEATPKILSVNTKCLPNAPTDPRAQQCYDAKIHVSHFRIAFGNLQWFDDRCTRRIAGDPICENHGKYLYTSLSLFDERRDFHDGTIIQDRPTGNFIYRMDLREFLPAGTTANPFKTLNSRTSIKGDTLATFKKAILEADKKRLGAGTQYEFPRRLEIDGRLETDEEYLSHFGFNSTNIGYEVTGLSQMGFDVHKFTMTGIQN